MRTARLLTVLGGLPCQRECALLGGLLCRGGVFLAEEGGGSALQGVCPPGGLPYGKRQTLMLTECRMTDTCKNITFARFATRAVKIKPIQTDFHFQSGNQAFLYHSKFSTLSKITCPSALPLNGII